MAIPFIIPNEFHAKIAVGAITRYGGILKDAKTGQIVAHLQETGAMQKIASQVLTNNPATGLAKLGFEAANTGLAIRADRKLTNLTNMVGAMQTMQMVGVASSVLGLGVTVASTAMILSRLSAITKGLQSVSEKIDRLPGAWQELELQKTLGDVQTQLERLDEVGTRKAPRTVVLNAEDTLHTAFNRLHQGTATVLIQAQVSPELLEQLLNGLALSGGAQIRALYELDELGTAESRARTMFTKLQQLSMAMPRDALTSRLAENTETAGALSGAMSQIRLSMASQPSLATRLTALEVSGPDYLAHARDEDEEPLLFLPAG